MSKEFDENVFNSVRSMTEKKCVATSSRVQRELFVGNAGPSVANCLAALKRLKMAGRLEQVKRNSRQPGFVVKDAK